MTQINNAQVYWCRSSVMKKTKIKVGGACGRGFTPSNGEKILKFGVQKLVEEQCYQKKDIVNIRNQKLTSSIG